jgi:ATP-binding cassette, subfamily B, bacterial
MAPGAPSPPIDSAAPPPSGYPALQRLSWRGRRRPIPFVRQMQWADCGAACLGMVLSYHGRPTRLEEVRQAVGSYRDGVDAAALCRGAEWFGMRGRGLQVDIDDLRYLPRTAILHWEFTHFVVFDGLTRAGVAIMDPAYGRRVVPLEQFRRSFTGVALVIEPTEAFDRTGARRTEAWSYLRHLFGQKRLLGRVVVTSVILRVFALALPVLTALIVDRVVPRGDERLLVVVGAGLAGVLLFHFLSQLIRSHLLLQLRTNLDTRMTLGFLDHLVNLPYSFFQQRSAGDLMLRLNSNVTIRQILTSNTLSALLDGTLVVAYLVIIMWLSAPLGAVTLALGTLEVAVFVVSRQRYRNLMSQDLEAQARAHSYLVQVMQGIETLKVAGAEHRAVEHWSNLFVDELNVALKRGRLSATVDSLRSALQIGSPLIILSLGAIMVIDGELSLGTMLALNALAVGFLTPLSSLVASALRVQELGSYVERIEDVMTAELEQDRGKVSRAPNLSGHISVREVSFRYGPNAPWVVRNASLEIAPGSSVAIVGKSGSGKTTLANLLVGLYPASDGVIVFDGRRLPELDIRSVRRQLGIVPQSPYVFAASVRDNIALADPAVSREQIIQAAKRACLHDDILAMPMGYDTIVADGGASLSGGQRQRLALARALVHEPAILLLDEATSALDAVTEKAVMANLAELRATRIIIAHRLSTIVDADQIVVMDDGRIVERGRHSELVGQLGVYRSLIALQGAADAGQTESSRA